MILSKPRQVPPPLDGARASAYARFIPREELSSFASWEPGDISDAPGAEPLRRAREPEAAVDPVAALAEQMRATRQAGYQDGYRDGLVALEGFKQSFAAQTTAQVATLVASLGEQLEALQQEMAATLARAATQMARQVVRSELATRPECVGVVAEQAIEALLLSARHIVMRVHPDDQVLVEAGAGDALAARGVRLVADPAIQRGGCRVDSDIGIVDATIGERWRRAATLLGSDAPWSDPADGEAS